MIETECEVCKGPLTKLDHIVPDIYIDLNDDGVKTPLCRNCAFAIMFSGGS